MLPQKWQIVAQKKIITNPRAVTSQNCLEMPVPQPCAPSRARDFQHSDECGAQKKSNSSLHVVARECKKDRVFFHRIIFFSHFLRMSIGSLVPCEWDRVVFWTIILGKRETGASKNRMSMQPAVQASRRGQKIFLLSVSSVKIILPRLWGQASDISV
ncbi:hypothetical protein BC940DRAFT_305138 [Gongronella butleri]|nr:hypothetical protein BC940DRAFT_305138 [Gongronella butleri]